MRIVTYNIRYGKGRDGRIDLDRIAAALDGADLVGLQEVERFWERSGNADQPAELASRMPGFYWAYGPGVDVHLPTADAAERALGRRRQFGNMVLSRWPILAVRNLQLPRWSALGPMTLQRALLETVIDAPAGPLRAYCTHLCYLSGRLRIRQAAAILEIIRTAPKAGRAVEGRDANPAWSETRLPPVPREAVLTGDFNMEPGSPEYAVLAGEMHPEHGPLAGLDGMVVCWHAAGRGAEDGATDYQDLAARTGRRIDYVFVTPGLARLVRDAAVDAGAAGSDHQPLAVALDL